MLSPRFFNRAPCRPLRLLLLCAVVAGVGFLGHLWKRNNDRAGLAFASNGISKVHADSLALGGTGMIPGDGGLRYGRETLTEA